MRWDPLQRLDAVGRLSVSFDRRGLLDLGGRDRNSARAESLSSVGCLADQTGTRIGSQVVISGQIN